MTSRGCEPLKIYYINDSYILGVYRGKLSEYDLLLKYRQRDSTTKSGWSRIRTPKHIHWAVDILIKLSQEKEQTNSLLTFLLEYWNNFAKPLKSNSDLEQILTDNFLLEIENECGIYDKLAKKGEYSIKFLILIAKLLMIQEKTNLENAYMFKDLLVSLKEGKDIFKIVSIATHR